MIRKQGSILVVGLLMAACAFAQPLDRFQFQVPNTPAVGGWYSPLTNLGGVTFDIIYDPARSVVAGQWSYQVNGSTTTVFFQTDIEYSTAQDLEDSGIFAHFDSPTFTFVGRGDYSDPTYAGNGTPVFTGRTVRMEFYSSRSGTFIDNPGQSDERRFPVVATLRGMPLVEQTSYAGDWMVASRTEATGAHFDFVGVVSLTPYTGPETYQFHPLSGFQPVAYDPPQPGARRYRLACPNLIDPTTGAPPAGTLTPCEQVIQCGFSCPAGEPSLLIWVNPDETGGFAQVYQQANQSVLVQGPYFPPRVLGDTGKITVRGHQGATLLETQFTKIADGLFRPQ